VKNIAAQSKPIGSEKDPANSEGESVQLEQFNSKQCDGLFEYLYRRYAECESLFSVEETALYAAGTKYFNESDSQSPHQ